MLTINRQPTANNNILTNNLTNSEVITNYVQKINEALHSNDKKMLIADRVIYDIEYISSKINYDPQKILSHIENIMINFLSQQHFFDNKIIRTNLKYYKLNMQLDDLTKQITIIEQEVSNYIDKFPNMIKKSVHYKEIINSFFKPINDIANNITLKNEVPTFMLTDLINAVNLIKEKNKLLPQKKILEQTINNFIEYSYHTEVTQNNITSLINELSSAANLEVVTYYPYIYKKAFRLLAYLNQIKDIDITASLTNYDYSCTRYEQEHDIEKKDKEHIKLANNIHKKIHKLDSNILTKIYNIKERATRLKQAIAQN